MKTTFVQIDTFRDVDTDTVFWQSSLEKGRSRMVTVESLRPPLVTAQWDGKMWYLNTSISLQSEPLVTYSHPVPFPPKTWNIIMVIAVGHASSLILCLL